MQAGGIALEDQGFPCAPDFAHFLASTPDPGQTYVHQMDVGFIHGIK